MITATDVGNNAVTGTSQTINVTPGNAESILIDTPATAVAGTPFSATLTLKDAYGNVATGYTGTVHFSVPTDSNVEGLADYTFNGGDAGVHMFSVTLHKAGTHMITASDSAHGLTVTSGSILVAPGAPAKLAYQTQPPNTNVGVAIPDFKVEIQDADGNLTGSTASVAVAIGNDPSSGAATLSGTTSVNAVAGVATFTGLQLDKAKTGYTLIASSDSLTSKESDAFNVGKGSATLSLSNLSHTYDGMGKSATVTTIPSGLTGVSVTYDGSASLPINAGDHAVVASLTNDDYQATDATGTLNIAKATSTTTVTFEAGPYTYRGTAFLATATATGAGSLSVAVTPVTYGGDCTNVTSDNGCSASATFAGDANHEGSSGSANITITKATPTVTVTAPNATYTGSPYAGLSYTIKGVGNVDLTPATVNYSGANGTVYPKDPTPPTNAGDYTVRVSFAGNQNYAPAGANAAFTIAKATSTTVVTFEAGPYVYRNSTFTATVSVSGVNLNLAPSPSYSGDCTNVTVLYGCTASYSYAGDENHESSSDSKSITILKAPSTTAVTFEVGPYTYRASPFTASVSVTGVNLNLAPSPAYSGDCTNVTATDGCSASYVYSGDQNHSGSTGSASITITKATPTVTVNAPSTTYTGLPYTGYAYSVTGAGGADLSSSAVVQFAPAGGGSPSTTPPTSAGDYTVRVTSPASQNYTLAGANAAFTIAKAISTTTVTFEAGPYTYRASGFTAGVTVTGVGGLGLTPGASYGGDCLNVTVTDGCTASYSYPGDSNHQPSSDSKSITITKAGSTTVVTFEAGPYTYRNSAFAATAQVTGVGGLNTGVSPVIYSGDCVNVTTTNGCTGTATYGGDQNHDGSTGSASITIEKASSTTMVTFESGPYTYRGTAFTANASVTGVNLSSALSVTFGGDCTNVTTTDGCTASASFAGDTNHTGSSDSKAITITKATPTVTLTAPNATFNASPYTGYTYSVTGVGGADLTSSAVVQFVPLGGSPSTTPPTNAGDYVVRLTSPASQNYTLVGANAAFTIAKAISTTTVTFEAAPYVYRGSAFTAGTTVTGVGGLSLTPSVSYSGDCLNVTVLNGCTASYSYAGDGNHQPSSDSKSITITKSGSTTVVTFEAGPYTYRGSAFGATAAVSGVGGLSGGVTSVTYSGDCTNVTGTNGCTATATFAGDGNHNGSTGSASITIVKTPASVTPNAASKVYGSVDPAFTGTLSGFLAQDGVTATYSRTAGETVPGSPYTISVTLSATGLLSNYAITYNTAAFTITKKNATVTVNSFTKVFGQPDPTFTGTLSGFLPSDGVTATYSRTSGETVAGSPYTISATLSPPGVLSNYAIAATTGTLTITPWSASGFYQPVDMGTVVNTIKAGSTVPLKFEIFAGALGTNEQTNVSAVLTIQQVTVNCVSGVESAITSDELATGGTVLRYDATAGQFIFNWQSPKGAIACYDILMTAADNTTTLRAHFKTK
jgi:hypothetical protein